MFYLFEPKNFQLPVFLNRFQAGNGHFLFIGSKLLLIKIPLSLIAIMGSIISQLFYWSADKEI